MGAFVHLCEISRPLIMNELGRKKQEGKGRGGWLSPIPNSIQQSPTVVALGINGNDLCGIKRGDENA